MTLKLILLTESFTAKAAFEFVNFVVQDLDVFLEIRVTVERRSAKLTCVAVFMALGVMLDVLKNSY